MEWKYARSYFKNFKHDFAWIFGISVTIVLAVIALQRGGAMIDLYCSPNSLPILGIYLQDYIPCLLLAVIVYILFLSFGFALAWFLVSALIDILIWIFKIIKFGIMRFKEWMKTLSSKNLHLFPGSLRNNIYTLWFVNAEWRYPFSKMNAFINMQRLVPLGLDISDSGINLEWRKQITREPLDVKRFFRYELNFLRVDAKNDTFQIMTKNNEEFKFPPGIYGFTVMIGSNIFRNFKTKFSQNILIEKIGFKFLWKEICLIVDYRGYNQIFIKLTNKEEYERNIWFKQWQENQKDNPPKKKTS